MKYILTFLFDFIYFFIFRPLLTIVYILWHFDLPNFSAYFYYAELIEFHEGRLYKFLVYRKISDAMKDKEPLYELYADDGKKYRYFPKWDMNDIFN